MYQKSKNATNGIFRILWLQGLALDVGYCHYTDMYFMACLLGNVGRSYLGLHNREARQL
jgi:hypothetical protein